VDYITTLLVSKTVASNGRVIYELERIWKEAFVI
jgi:ribosomal silencing factor RsfS